MFPPRADDYRFPDGSVVVPARAVEGMLRLLELGVTAARQKGAAGAVNLDMVIVLDALQDAALHPGSVLGTTVADTPRLESLEKLLAVADAAARLGCSERAVRKACIEGRLRAVKVGHRWLIDERELDRYRFGEGATDGDSGC